MRFVEDKVALGQVSVPVRRLISVSVIPAMFNTHRHAVCYFYENYRREIHGNRPKSNAVSGTGDRWMEKCFHFLSLKGMLSDL